MSPGLDAADQGRVRVLANVWCARKPCCRGGQAERLRCSTTEQVDEGTTRWGDIQDQSPPPRVYPASTRDED